MPSSKPDGTDPSPAVTARLAEMAEADLDSVLAIERVSFPTPWTRENFLFELRDNPFARNVVIRLTGKIVGYSCLWVIDRELKINNIAIGPEHRGSGLGAKLLDGVLELGVTEGCTEATLEVRPSNMVARRLYDSRGFEVVGRRKGYYQDTGEDALLMRALLSPPSRASTRG